MRAKRQGQELGYGSAGLDPLAWKLTLSVVEKREYTPLFVSHEHREESSPPIPKRLQGRGHLCVRGIRSVVGEDEGASCLQSASKGAGPSLTLELAALSHGVSQTHLADQSAAGIFEHMEDGCRGPQEQGHLLQHE